MKLNSIEAGRIDRQSGHFLQSPAQTTTAPIDNEKKDSKALESTLVALGVIVMGTIAAVTAFKKGNAAGMKTGLKQVIEQGIKDGLKDMRNIDLDAFKKVGNFKKGKAFINGKEFSGTIYTPNGHKLIYQNGVLSRSVGAKSQKYYSNGKLYCAEYKPNRVGDVEKVVVERNADGTREYKKFLADFAERRKPLEQEIITTIKPDGSITRRYTNLKKKAKVTGSEYKYDKIVDLKTKKCTGIKIKDVKKADASNIQHKEHSFVDGKKVTKEYKNGELAGSYITEYNHRTGIAVETHTNKNGSTDYVVRNPKDNTAISTRFGGGSFALHGRNGGFFESLDELKHWVSKEKINIDSKLLNEIAKRIA